jgi:type I restriction enzyme, S subunit
MSKWERKTLGDFLSLQRGYDLTAEEREFGNVPVIGAAGQNGFHNQALVSAPGIIVGRCGGSFGQVHFVKEDFWPHNTAMFVTDFRGNDPFFTYYLLKNLDFSQLNSGSAQPSLNRNYVYPVKIIVPQPNDQKKIAAVLSTLDAKIECNNRINAELEAMAKTLYDYWFVQFNFPDHNGQPYKSSGGKMVYNPTLKRQIPAGWESGSLSEWIAYDKTGDWGKESNEGNYTLQVECIRGTDINGLNGTGTIAAPTRFILEKNTGKILDPFDFVIEISGGSPTQSTGRMAFILPETTKRFAHPIICSNFCKAISLKDNTYFFNFAYEWQSAYDNKILFGWEGKTSGIKNLLFNAFVSKYIVSKPPQKFAQLFFEFVSPLQIKKQKLLQQNENLEALRDWLLPMLMNGQVTVASG